jgi:Sec-independent protein translocase protein TatA
VAGELGKGIRSFREGLSGKKDENAPEEDKPPSEDEVEVPKDQQK